MNEKRDLLLHTLDQSISTFASIRTPDAICTAAFDTLKQARAMIARALAAERDLLHTPSRPATACPR